MMNALESNLLAETEQLQSRRSFLLNSGMGLGTAARMNAPGSSGGRNWRWRFTKKQLKGKSAKRLRELTETYGRLL